MAEAIFDPLHPDVIDDPYPAYRRLRETDPVHWHAQLESWVLTRHADCVEVLRDAERFTTDWRKIGVPTPPTLLSLQTLDPPDQTPLRHLGLDAMRAQDLTALEADARARAESLLATLAPSGPFDFITEFADHFTLGTMCRLLNVERPPEAESWSSYNDDLNHSMDAGFDPEAEAPGIQARRYFNALVERWLADPPGSGVLAYVAEHRDEAGVEHEVLVNSIRAFFHAGFEVPSRFLGNAVLALLTQPRALARLREQSAGQGVSAAAVDELVRYAAPVHALSRACTKDTEIGGKTIRQGQIVTVLIGAANRDPEVFDRPDELVLDRAPNPHLGFGRGTHSCLGNHIGRLEGRVVVETLLRHYPGIRLAGDPVRRPNATLRGLAKLPVMLTVT